MSNRLIVLGSSAFFALVGLATAAPAAVIDTFFFLELERDVLE